LIPVYDGGKIQGIYDAFRNMTDTVMGARKLRESETRLRLATKVAKLGVFVWDTAQDIGSWDNDRVYEIFGRSREQGPVNGAAFLGEVVYPDDREAFQTAVEDTLHRGEPFCFEGRIYLPDATVRWIEIDGELQPATAGSTGKIFGTVRDITETRKNEELLQENAKRLGELAAIVATSEDVILSKDLNGIVTSWNHSATRVFGYSAEEMIGTSILKLIPEHLHPEERIILDSIRAGRRIDHFETIRRAKDGRLIDVSVTVSPVKDGSGRIVGASKILRDISKRKQIEQSLLQSEKIAATGRMAATIAHEINNPLEAVMNLLYLLRPMIANPDGIQYLASAEAELGRVSHIAKQTLGYYREHASASPAALSEILAHAITIYEPRCGVVGIDIRTSIDSKRKLVLRRGEMMQVVSNLIANSIYGMPQGGILSISLDETSSPIGEIVLTIQDNGVGIPPAALPKVFDAFFTTRSTVGTGIGLFVAKQFVEGHGGQINIESDVSEKDHGTIVRIVLPMRTTYENLSTTN
jgi:PAS domain S-box-containing protein